MEDSWQIQFGSTLQSLTSSMASSSSSLELHNQTERNAGYYPYTHDPNDLRRKVLGAVQGPPVPNHLNFSSSHKPTHVSLGNSFLALLSGPPSPLQCDFRELSNSKLLSDSNSVVVNAVEGTTPSTLNGLPSENLSEQNRQLGADFYSSISARMVGGSNSSTNSVFPGLQIPELETTVIHRVVTCKEKPKCSFSVSGDWHAKGPSSKVSCTKVHTSELKSVVENSALSSHSPYFLSNCPRVFCEGIGGYLLISNTGLLGIVCACHNLHMSVLKFCKHAGSCGGNAGDFVRMESGETIAMWRKLYFLNFGIRISEDESDWDWPEGLTATSDLVKSRTIFPNNSCNISHLAQISEGILRPGQVSDCAMLSHPHNWNSVVETSQNKQKRNAQDGKSVSFEYGTSQRNMHILEDTQILEHTLSGFSAVSKPFSGPQDYWYTAYADTMKNANSSYAHPAVQDLRTIVQKSDFSMSKSAPNGVFIGRDAALSNIELKLGQPNQSSQNSKLSDQTTLGTRLVDTFVNPSKLILTQQMLHNSCQSRVEYGQSFCNSNNKSEQSQLNFGNGGSDLSTVNIAATPAPDKSGGNLDHNAVGSSLSNFNHLSGNSVQINSNNNMLSSTKPSAPHPQYIKPRFTAWDSAYVPRNCGNSLERQFTVTGMGPTDKNKVVRLASNGPYFMKDSGIRTHRETETSTSHPWSSAAQGSNVTLHQLSRIPLKASDVRRLSNNPANCPPFENNYVDHVTHRSLTSKFGSQQILPSQVVKKGLPLASSTCLSDQTPALHREDGISLRTQLCDDNSRILALRQMLEVSKQQDTFSSIGMNKWEGRCDGISHFHHSHTESLFPGNQCNGSGVAGSNESSEAAVRAYLSGATNINGCCDLSTLIQEISMNLKETDGQGQISIDPVQNEQFAMGQNKKDIPGPRDHEKCVRESSACFQRSCICSVHMNCSERNSDSKGGSSPYAYNEQSGKVIGETSVRFGLQFPQTRSGPNSEIPPMDQAAMSNGNLYKSIVGHASQWRDVPSKMKGISKVMCRYTSANCTKSSEQIMHSYQEHINSNISSGSSAPAVTELSVEISNMDSSGADAGNTGCIDNLVDEGSAIDRCWSSDDAHGSERSAELHKDICKTSFNDSGSYLNANHQSSRSLLDELKLINSLTWKKVQKKNQMEMPVPKDKPSNKYSKCLKRERKKDSSSVVHCENYGETKFADFPSSMSKSLEMISVPKSNDSEHGLPASSSLKKPIRKRDLCKLYNDEEDRDECQTKSVASASNCKFPEVAAGKKFKRNLAGASGQSLIEGKTDGGSRTMKNRNLADCLKSSLSSPTNHYSCWPRPVVCGKFGELSTGEFGGDTEKPSKIVPLSRVLKSARRCELAKNRKPTESSMRKLKRTDSKIKQSYVETHHLNSKERNRSHGAADYGEASIETSLEEMKDGFSGGDYKFSGNFSILEDNRNCRNKKDCSEEDSIANSRKSKTKEIRKRSIYELTVDDTDFFSTSRKGPHPKKSFLSEVSERFPEMTEGKLLRDGDDRKHEFCKVDEKSPQGKTFSLHVDSNSFCCVCGSSNKDEYNHLLQCNRCLIKVHQACYGVSKVPKVHWLCRPCRTGSKNIVCVLCGYGGGAMTQALQSRAIVKCLLRVRNFEMGCKLKDVFLPVKISEKSPNRWDCSDSVGEGGRLFPRLQLENTEPLASAVGKIDFSDDLHDSQNSQCVTKIKVDNSITAGLVNSTAKQWVHMVCGLWTPGTRCPNVDTMSAFDVSGALRPKADVVCSICSRPGGICIKCRVLNCSVHFHPWCAHQKGLLQSEVEGVDNENVGFYGRCLSHATNPMCVSDPSPTDRVIEGSGIDELTCARTEGYRGRKRDGFHYNYYNQSKAKVGCHVPQEQLNAWIHINGQKSGIQGLPRLPISDIEHDCRKEYARYKQGTGWKHLVVYKSGIHALGLYTSRFIYRGEMVVEYIGEIVGLRVSDKRENEYQSGRKLQYKSACYFFRIDKEHIIDATRKGGIARFVNHSCLPNCVAKVITIRNDKKVVFFADRDIFPGEEITYDYHFNHEDEGKKIPCFCNSKNCRRYLN